jgi:DnaJ-class molecular chaperone
MVLLADTLRFVRQDKCSEESPVQVLAIDTAAGEATVKQAKRQLSLLTHPDKSSIPGSREAFQLVTDAAEVLLDAGKRKAYDRELAGLAASARQSTSARSERTQQRTEPSAEDVGSFELACGYASAA